MFIVRPPLFVRLLYPNTIWRKEKNQKRIYLTFDDGPIPEVTPFVLNTLSSFGIKGTFFCVGENIKKHPSIFDQVKSEGHQIGNHTYNHLKGWDTNDKIYLKNVEECQSLTKTNLFRPPYGRASRLQIKSLAKKYEIIMWDVLTGDYDPKISPESCLKNCLKYSRNGSILVFHDNIKAYRNLQYALPKSIGNLLNRGYEFSTL